MKKFLIAVILGVLTLTTGCFDVTEIVTVNKDGSGTVEEIMYMNKAFAESMKAMAGQMSSAMGATNKPAESMFPDDEASYRNKAAQLGEGVKFVSMKKVTKDGAEGIHVTYSFDDVRNLNLTTDAKPPVSEGGMGQAEGSSGKPIKFDFTGGDTPRLVVAVPHDEPDAGTPVEAEAKDDTAVDEEGESEPGSEGGEEAGEGADAMQAGMMQMFEGFRVCYLVKVNGEVKKTNAAFIEKAPGSATVTLFDLNIGQLLKDPQMAKKLTGMGSVKTVDDAMEAYKNFPGIKVDPAKEVEIEFQ